MIQQEVIRRADREILSQVRQGAPQQRHLSDWGALIMHHARGVRNFAHEGCDSEALHELRKLLATALAAAQEYGIPDVPPGPPRPTGKMSDIRHGDKYLMPTTMSPEGVRQYVEVTVVATEQRDGIQHIAALGRDGNTYQFGDQPDAPYYLERVAK